MCSNRVVRNISLVVVEICNNKLEEEMLLVVAGTYNNMSDEVMVKEEEVTCSNKLVEEIP